MHADGLAVLRRGADDAPVVIAVGPTLDEAAAATGDLDVTLAYLSTVRPFDAAGLEGHRAERTSSRRARPRRDVCSGGRRRAAGPPRTDNRSRRPRPRVAPVRHLAEHRAAQGPDAAGIRAELDEFLAVPAARDDTAVRYEMVSGGAPISACEP